MIRATALALVVIACGGESSRAALAPIVAAHADELAQCRARAKAQRDAGATSAEATASYSACADEVDRRYGYRP